MTPQDKNSLAPASQPTQSYIKALFPGLAVAVIAALAAAWLSEHYGAPIILMGLLVGLALNFVSTDERTHKGLDFAGQTGLRIGIVLLGTQVTLVQIGALGPLPFIGVVTIMGVTIAVGIVSAKALRQGNMAGLLAGGATAICGASAALALYSLIGKDRISQARFTLTLVGISLASAVAMSFYPAIAAYLDFSDRQAGFLIGAAVHDVAQAIGGGYNYSREAGEVATIVKLTRVTLLAPMLALIGLFIGMHNDTGKGKVGKIIARLRLPWFIAGFLAIVVINSTYPLEKEAVESFHVISKALLLLAVTATAMRSRIELLLAHGWRSLAPIICATLTAFLIALAFASVLK